MSSFYITIQNCHYADNLFYVIGNSHEFPMCYSEGNASYVKTTN